MANRDFERTLQVLDSLLHGLDPVTGDELSSDSVINRIAVNRALLIAVTAVKQSVRRINRRSFLPRNTGKPWSRDEEQALVKEHSRNLPISEIAESHSRSLTAIQNRLVKLGLVSLDPGVANTVPVLRGRSS